MKSTRKTVTQRLLSDPAELRKTLAATATENQVLRGALIQSKAALDECVMFLLGHGKQPSPERMADAVRGVVVALNSKLASGGGE
jgi:hypothetical protein